jgi:hypothetical protein
MLIMDLYDIDKQLVQITHSIRILPEGLGYFTFWPLSGK